MAANHENSPIPLTRPWFPEEMRRDICADMDKIMSSGALMMGEFAKALEANYCSITGTQHAVSLSTATTGLQIALRHAGVAGGEVLVPAASFITDVSAVQMEGATPVLVDVDPATLTYDLDQLERRLTPKTRAIIWVHLIGFIGPAYAEIKDFAKRNGLFLIEDASHAHGAVIDGRKAGSLGDVGVFSFYPTKLMTTGTGGMLTTDNAALADYARSMRIFGKDLKTGEIVERGNDWFMDEFRACIGFHQSRRLGEGLSRRRAAAGRYMELLRQCNSIRCLEVADGSMPAWYQFPVFAEDDETAEAIRRRLGEQGIACKQIYKPVHREQLFLNLADTSLRGAEEALNRSMCLPIFADITEEEVERVAAALLEAVEQA